MNQTDDVMIKVYKTPDLKFIKLQTFMLHLQFVCEEIVIFLSK